MARTKTAADPLNRPRNGQTDSSMEQALVRAAVEARERATAPYSQFKVGAALLTKTGRIISGVNVESASYGLTCCAERVALFNALSQGERSFVAIAVVAAAEGGPMPCGACRQLLAEYAAGILILSADINDLEKTRRYSIEQLLPSPFLQVPQNSTT